MRKTPNNCARNVAKFWPKPRKKPERYSTVVTQPSNAPSTR